VAKLLVDSTHVPWKNIKTVIATQSMPFEIDIWDRSSNFGYTILPNSLESRNELLDAFKEHFGKRLTVQKKRESLWKAGWPIFMTVFYVFLTIVGVFMVFEGGNHGVARGRGAGLANAIAAIADNLGIPGVLAIGGLFVAIGIGHSIWKASKRKYLIELRPRW